VTRTLLRAGIAGIALVLTASLAGCFGLPGAGGGDPEPIETETETPQVEAGFGVPIRIEQADGVAELTINGATWNEDAPGGLPFVAEQGGYLILDATWTTLEGETSIVANFTMVQDANGVNGGYFTFVERVFAKVGLPAGESITGDIGFDIGAGPYTFIAYDDVIQEVARFTFEAEPRESDGVR
jgi:hypothetical protein